MLEYTLVSIFYDIKIYSIYKLNFHNPLLQAFRLNIDLFIYITQIQFL